MEEYLKSFFEYQDRLFWTNDIDDLDVRIELWLKSDQCREFKLKNPDVKL